MSDETEDDLDDAGPESATAEAEVEVEVAAKLDLEVQIASRSSCQRHITVTISRADIERYMGKAFTEMAPKASVPGFRAGRAPRKLVEARFKKDVVEQIKGSLVVDSLTQISEDYDLSPISEPDFDPMSIVVPDDGPMRFEFDIEVRPEFDLPNWKGLKIGRPVRKFTEADVERELQNVLSESAKLVAKDGPAVLGDFVQVDIAFKQGSETLNGAQNEVVRIRPVLSFRDCNVNGFDKLMKGVVAGETRVGETQLTDDAPNPALRGQKLQVEFQVKEVRKVELPAITPALLEELGNFESEEALRATLRASLERKLEYLQHQQARDQILAALTVGANWDLPPAMLKRQYGRELERAVLELKRNGFGDREILAYENTLRQNAKASTERALKQHFILERIAEEEHLEDLPEDYTAEIKLIAEQSNESPRRLRAKLEKRGQMDALRNQIVERKAIDLILEHAVFNEIQQEPDADAAEAIDQAAGGGDDHVAIPEAHYSDGPEKLERKEAT
jgi:trigger factor